MLSASLFCFQTPLTRSFSCSHQNESIQGVFIWMLQLFFPSVDIDMNIQWPQWVWHRCVQMCASVIHWWLSWSAYVMWREACACCSCCNTHLINPVAPVSVNIVPPCHAPHSLFTSNTLYISPPSRCDSSPWLKIHTKSHRVALKTLPVRSLPTLKRSLSPSLSLAPACGKTRPHYPVVMWGFWTAEPGRRHKLTGWWG